MPQAGPCPGHTRDWTKAAATTSHLPIWHSIGAGEQKWDTWGETSRETGRPGPHQMGVCVWRGEADQLHPGGRGTQGASEEVMLEPRLTELSFPAEGGRREEQ